MNRIIKFRAWDREENRFAYGINSHLFYLVQNYPERFILNQFTGLLDKSGKAIYEGDIVKYKYMEGFECEEDGWENEGNEMIKEVKFINGEFTPREDGSFPEDGYYAWRTHSFEIIGNIYENSELIK